MVQTRQQIQEVIDNHPYKGLYKSILKVNPEFKGDLPQEINADNFHSLEVAAAQGLGDHPWKNVCHECLATPFKPEFVDGKKRKRAMVKCADCKATTPLKARIVSFSEGVEVMKELNKVLAAIEEDERPWYLKSQDSVAAMDEEELRKGYLEAQEERKLNAKTLAEVMNKCAELEKALKQEQEKLKKTEEEKEALELKVKVVHMESSLLSQDTVKILRRGDQKTTSVQYVDLLKKNVSKPKESRVASGLATDSGKTIKNDTGQTNGQGYARGPNGGKQKREMSSKDIAALSAKPVRHEFTKMLFDCGHMRLARADKYQFNQFVRTVLQDEKLYCVKSWSRIGRRWLEVYVVKGNDEAVKSGLTGKGFVHSLEKLRMDDKARDGAVSRLTFLFNRAQTANMSKCILEGFDDDIVQRVVKGSSVHQYYKDAFLRERGLEVVNGTAPNV